MNPHRFPPPWTVVEHAESYWVQDATGQAVGQIILRYVGANVMYRLIAVLEPV
jgi:hypothetical protein